MRGKRAIYCRICGSSVREVGKIQRWSGYGMKRKIPICSFCRWDYHLYNNEESIYYYLKKKGEKYGVLVVWEEKEIPKNCKYNRICVWGRLDIRKTLRAKNIKYDKKYDNYGFGI